MSSIYIPIESENDCSDAFYDPTLTESNADVDGLAVAVASVVIAICLRIQVSFAPAKPDTGIRATLLQIYSILIAAFMSINRGGLSLFDVTFVLNLTFSPLTMYLGTASIGESLGFKTSLYERIESHRLIILGLGTLFPILWVALSGVRRLSDHAFTDSDICKGSKYSHWVRDILQVCMNLITLAGAFPFAYLVNLVPFVLLLFRRRSQIVREARYYVTQRERTPLGFLRMLYLVLRCPWDIVVYYHGWYAWMLFVYADIGWGMGIISSAISALEDDYTLSYGQILSVITAAPPFLSTVKLAYFYRRDLLSITQRLPELFLIEMVYLVTGKELDPLVWKSHLPSTYPTSLVHGLQASDTFFRILLQFIGSNSHPCSEPHPMESRQPGVPATGPSDTLAHPGPQRHSTPAPPVLDLPLAVIHDLIPVLLQSETTVESVESVCADHRLSPQVTELIVQVVGKSLPPVHERQRGRNPNDPNSFTAAIVTSSSVAPSTVRRATWSSW